MDTKDRINIGIIGCGNISSIYMENIPRFKHLMLKACTDLDLDRAKEQAERFNIPKVYTVDEMIADEEIDLVINLTTPQAHAETCIKVLEAKKHVYVEKPLAVSLEEGRAILNKAKEMNCLVGSAPDTFLGAGIQTAIRLIEEGEIGTPIGASAFMIGRGHEHWHPNPEFYYKKGGGPMFDMGPYYITALIAALGPIKRLSGSTRISYPERTILSEPLAGKKVKVEIPTHISGVIDFSSGAVATITTSFDAFGGSSLPPIEIYGSEGTLILPDPNLFGGPVKIRKKDKWDFVEVPVPEIFSENIRGLGVAEMAYAIINQTKHRASGEMAYHVLESMLGFHVSSENGTFYEMESTCEKPASLYDSPLKKYFS